MKDLKKAKSVSEIEALGFVVRSINLNVKGQNNSRQNEKLRIFEDGEPTEFVFNTKKSKVQSDLETF